MSGRRPSSTAPLPDNETVRELQRTILGWYAGHRRDLPWRRMRDPYAILVSEIMLQQTQVPRVIPKYGAFLAAFPTLESLAAAPLADVLRLWRGLGYNNRAVRLQRCALAVCQTRGAAPAALPQELPALQALPGLGPYTARAVLVFAHNADLAAVDANVRRVLTHELDLPHDLSHAKLQAVADAVLPSGHSRDWHNGLMDYGSEVLTSRQTRIPPRARQGAFVGSRRWHRSRLLQALLDGGAQSVDALSDALGLEPSDTRVLVELLERDGLLRRADGLVMVE